MDGLQFPFNVLESYVSSQDFMKKAEKLVEEWANGLGIIVEINLSHGVLPRRLTWKRLDKETTRIDAWSSGGLYTRIKTYERDSHFGHHADVDTIRVRTMIRIPELGRIYTPYEPVICTAEIERGRELDSQILQSIQVWAKEKAEAVLKTRLVSPVVIVIGNDAATDREQVQTDEMIAGLDRTRHEAAQKILAA